MKRTMKKCVWVTFLISLFAIAENPRTAEAKEVMTAASGTADFGEGSAVITIQGNQGQPLGGKIFRLYRLFYVENAVAGESVEYTVNRAYLGAMQSVVGRRIFKSPLSVTEYEIIDYIQSLNEHQTEGAFTEQEDEGEYSAYRYFVEELRNEIVKGKIASDIVRVRNAGEDNSVVISGLVEGYYMIDEVSRTEGIHSASSLCMVNTANAQAEIRWKSDYPAVTKKIQEDDNRDILGSDGWNDIADFEIGQIVPFQCESNIPDINGYDTYYYAWHDKMSEALTFDATSVAVRIYASASTQSKCYTLKKEEFSIIINSGNEETFQVEIQDIKKIVDREFDCRNAQGENIYGQKVLLSYQAQLNDKAAKDTGRPGFENDVRLEFSNDADCNGIGNTGYTPWDTVVCFTYRLNVLKMNEYGRHLEDAKFRLYSDKDCKQEVYVKKMPTGYHVIHRDSSGGTVPLESTELVSDAEGRILIYGLDGGTYYLQEIESPTGYRLMKDSIILNIMPVFTDARQIYVKGEGATDKTLQKLKVSANTRAFSEGLFHEENLQLETSAEHGFANFTVINKTGKKLPVTGSHRMPVLIGGGVLLMLLSCIGNRKKYE